MGAAGTYGADNLPPNEDMCMGHAATEARRRTITITLVEPYPLVRAAIHDILRPESDLLIVAEVAAIEEAIMIGRETPSDVVVVDTDVAVPVTVPVLQQLRRECPISALIVLGHRRDDDELFQAIEAGAAAHLADATRPSDLITTIRAVAAGEYVIDASVAARPEVARRVLDAFRSAALNVGLNDPETLPAFERLSTRESQILGLISEGMANKDIAAVLSISPNTVNNHVKAVLRKLAVNNRTQAVLLALRRSWISLPDGPSYRPN
jgi:DNA-binding NarL/FixJ family response regulator